MANSDIRTSGHPLDLSYSQSTKLTLPSSSEITMVSLADTQTLTNKTISGGTLTGNTVTDAVIGGSTTGVVITHIITFTENATNTLHSGQVTIPAGAWLHDIRITNGALWGAASASMDVGDTADPDGYFATIDLKATDLAVGEVLSMNQGSIDTDGMWGGQNGVYLVAATGRRGPTSTNFGQYYAGGTFLTGVITVGTPGATTGRTYMMVSYSVGEAIAATASTPA